MILNLVRNRFDIQDFKPKDAHRINEVWVESQLTSYNVRGYVAVLEGRGDNIPPGKMFLPPSESHVSKAGNGTHSFINLRDGIYEAHSVLTSRQAITVYFAVKGTEFFSLTKDEAWGRLGYDVARAAAEKKAFDQQIEDIALKMPAIKGTEKQIAWACDIRRNYIRKCLSHKQEPTVMYESARDWIDNSGTLLRREVVGSDVCQICGLKIFTGCQCSYNLFSGCEDDNPG